MKLGLSSQEKTKAEGRDHLVDLRLCRKITLELVGHLICGTLQRLGRETPLLQIFYKSSFRRAVEWVEWQLRPIAFEPMNILL